MWSSSSSGQKAGGKSKNLVGNLNAMFAARREFIRLECSSSLQKVLKSRIHPQGNDIVQGDWIYYYKDDSKGHSKIWRGPAQVSAVSGKKLFIDQVARLGTVNRDDALRVGEEFWKASDLNGDSSRDDSTD